MKAWLIDGYAFISNLKYKRFQKNMYFISMKYQNMI